MYSTNIRESVLTIGSFLGRVKNSCVCVLEDSQTKFPNHVPFSRFLLNNQGGFFIVVLIVFYISKNDRCPDGTIRYDSVGLGWDPSGCVFSKAPW